MRIKRIAAVTAGLMVAGGVFGTIAGMVVLIAWGMFDGGPFHFTLNDLSLLLQISVIFGGVLGAVLGPVAAWLLMRHVPLGLAVGGTTLGTLAAGGVALVATGEPALAMLYGMAGFAISAIGLRLRVLRRERRLLGS
ncbi:hypothetical protein [Longimicrobium sp.]|jgi:hypothetical protein|uniref:hypothetical protein n=1 Tax=Longimicrobium sp. TaxID=2029185 RepID=UPI002EDB0C26